MNEVFLGIDVGTTAVKLGLIFKGELIYEQARKVTTYFGEQGERYQLADELLDSIYLGIKEIPTELRERVGRIGFSVAMHSLMPVENCKADKIFIWSDTQATETIEAFRTTDLAKHFYQRTGTPIHTMSPFAKISYFKEKGLYPNVSHWFGLKELLMEAFTGEYLLDYSTASATGLLNLEQLDWDAEILEYLDISKKSLAQLVEPTYTTMIRLTLSEELELPESTNITIGASDGCLAAYGSYISTGVANSLTVGTSAAIRKVSQQAIFDIERQNFCYYLSPTMYVVGAPSNNGGCVLEWASKTLAENQLEFYETLSNQLEQSPIGANGLRFHPYVNGERAPFWRSGLTAEFKYMTIKHTKADLRRAVVEGVLMNIRTLKEMVGEISALTLSGGFFTNPALRTMTAEVLGTTCYHEQSTEPIFGLYYLLQETAVHNEEHLSVHFDQQKVEAYTTLYQDYFE
ncbi:gluconokinase [Enterococcus sp. JM4C]|uniref:gluconokinase n=1 Tax=Candidatus Enterococcus huntleyi TaxID=1857217 RepID=UPI00137A4207|nr:FGGY family carbohydrate kinase [Enterococcus sp. JM4C]KAF1299569.1 gluconokinase [Enterococcus sp. JM4C]